MKSKNNNCIGCGKSKLEKDTVAINKKLLGRDIEKFYCMDCLANYLDVTFDEVNEKIEEFREQGCSLFI
jgi:uncharacterized protein YlaI